MVPLAYSQSVFKEGRMVPLPPIHELGFSRKELMPMKCLVRPLNPLPGSVHFVRGLAHQIEGLAHQIRGPGSFNKEDPGSSNEGGYTVPLP
eukprot:1144605-Pelagomonas_calceolata.AAC.1